MINDWHCGTYRQARISQTNLWGREYQQNQWWIHCQRSPPWRSLTKTCLQLYLWFKAGIKRQSKLMCGTAKVPCTPISYRHPAMLMQKSVLKRSLRLGRLRSLSKPPQKNVVHAVVVFSWLGNTMFLLKTLAKWGRKQKLSFVTTRFD